MSTLLWIKMIKPGTARRLIPVVYILILVFSLVLFVYSAGVARDVHSLEVACNEYWVAEVERICPARIPAYDGGVTNFTFNLTKNG